MRLTAVLVTAVVAGAGCANLGDPPGGPPDTTPPVLVSIEPDSGVVVERLRDPVVVQFDEVIEEVPGGGAIGGGGRGGAGGLDNFFLLSPVAGPVEVSWHRSSVRVKPKEGWQPGRVYRLEIFPGIADLRRNRTETGRTVIFSTGPPLPSASVAGTALLWVEQRPLARGLIIAAPVPDTVGYRTLTDSTGAFRLDGIPPGPYVLYALADANGNRRRDRREAYDSIAVTVEPSATAVLWAFVHDTVGPRLRQAEVVDSVSVRLIFAQPLHTGTPLTAAQVDVLALPDSAPVGVDAVLTVAQYDSLLARERARADSVRQAAADSARRAAGDTAAAPAPPTPPAPRAAPATAAPDSLLRQLLAQRPAPSDRRVVRLGAPLAAGARFYVRVRGAVNLSGAEADGQAVFETPQPPEPAAADSAPPDSAPAPRRPPARRP